MIDDPVILLRRIGRRLVQRRRELGLTQTQIAEQTGIAQSYVARIEHGDVNLTIRTLVSLAAALDMTVAELVAADPLEP